MHYTPIDNIHKVIDPLFLNELQEELEVIKNVKQVNVQKEKAKIYQNKLANLTFLDPACGSGNFLTETYLSLRHLENEALKLIHGNQIQLDLDQNIIKVSLNQFYGIEINDFAVSVAKTALWIAESQMLEETRNIVTFEGSFLPLKTYTNIVEANALTIDWEDVVPKGRLNYIIGNPPFLGNYMRSTEQKADMDKLFKDLGFKKFGKLDFVACWYAKAAQYMQDTPIKTALVSTNSICQGISAIQLWKELFEDFNVSIIFAHRTFKWTSDAIDKAAVHVVVIGFTVSLSVDEAKYIYDKDKIISAKNINAYLLDAPSIFIDSRTLPIANVEKM